MPSNKLRIRKPKPADAPLMIVLRNLCNDFLALRLMDGTHHHRKCEGTKRQYQVSNSCPVCGCPHPKLRQKNKSSQAGAYHCAKCIGPVESSHLPPGVRRLRRDKANEQWE